MPLPRNLLLGGAIQGRALHDLAEYSDREPCIGRMMILRTWCDEIAKEKLSNSPNRIRVREPTQTGRCAKSLAPFLLFTIDLHLFDLHMQLHYTLNTNLERNGLCTQDLSTFKYL